MRKLGYLIWVYIQLRHVSYSSNVIRSSLSKYEHLGHLAKYGDVRFNNLLFIWWSFISFNEIGIKLGRYIIFSFFSLQNLQFFKSL